MLWDPEPEWKILLKSRTLRVDHWGCFPGKCPSLLPQSPWKPREWAALFSNEHWALLGFSLGPPNDVSSIQPPFFVPPGLHTFHSAVVRD